MVDVDVVDGDHVDVDVNVGLHRFGTDQFKVAKNIYAFLGGNGSWLLFKR